MPYCELSDIEVYLDADAVTALADDDGDGTADATVIAEAIASADAEVDAYISSQYSTPLTTVPVIVRRLAAKLAAHFLYLRRTEANIPEKWNIEIREVRRMLERIGRGEMQLGTSAAHQSGDLCATAKAEDDATFNATVMGGF
ncbi:MAG TPA: DUF1320 domain-containing protein [Candidatus Sumerlaeota bacterium]|nr:DUF1320 domain-containing protein [Candidatus Sumerlaeota bacterium]